MDRFREGTCRCYKWIALGKNVKRFRGGLVLKANRLLYHSTLGLGVTKKKKKDSSGTWARRKCQKMSQRSPRERRVEKKGAIAHLAALRVGSSRFFQSPWFALEGDGIRRRVVQIRGLERDDLVAHLSSFRILRISIRS